MAMQPSFDTTLAQLAQQVGQSMHRLEKCVRVAMYYPCSESGCHGCSRYDPGQDTRLALRSPLACATCGHSVSSHGSLSVISDDVLNARVAAALHIDSQAKAMEAQPDATVKQQHLATIAQLQKRLMSTTTETPTDITTETTTHVSRASASPSSPSSSSSSFASTSTASPQEKPVIADLMAVFWRTRYQECTSNALSLKDVQMMRYLCQSVISLLNSPHIFNGVDVEEVCKRQPHFRSLYQCWKRLCARPTTTTTSQSTPLPSSSSSSSAAASPSLSSASSAQPNTSSSTTTTTTTATTTATTTSTSATSTATKLDTTMSSTTPSATDGQHKNGNTSCAVMCNTFGVTMLRSLFPLIKAGLCDHIQQDEDTRVRLLPVFINDLRHALSPLPPTTDTEVATTVASDAGQASPTTATRTPTTSLAAAHDASQTSAYVTPTNAHTGMGPVHSSPLNRSMFVAFDDTKEAVTHIPPGGKDHVFVQVITNDGSPYSLYWLNELRLIFSAQLPKMPREYIVRLVFNDQHRSLLCIRDGVLVGGICIRPFWDHHFAEIAFLAVTRAHQVRGYGTMLMNHMKAYCQSVGIKYALTYADNFAVGYFRKQGFTEQVALSASVWRKRIKDYDGGTLMQLTVYSEIPDYLSVRDMIKRQTEHTMRYVMEREREKRHRYPGLTAFRKGKKRIRMTDIPGVNEAGWTRKEMEVDFDALDELLSSNPHLLKKQLLQLWKAVAAHTDAWPFLRPVDPKEVPNYYEEIKAPMDLSTMRSKLREGVYQTQHDFMKDLTLMCDNCQYFNEPESTYYKAAVSLFRFSVNRMRNMRRELARTHSLLHKDP